MRIMRPTAAMLVLLMLQGCGNDTVARQKELLDNTFWDCSIELFGDPGPGLAQVNVLTQYLPAGDEPPHYSYSKAVISIPALRVTMSMDFMGTWNLTSPDTIRETIEWVSVNITNSWAMKLSQRKPELYRRISESLLENARERKVFSSTIIELTGDRLVIENESFGETSCASLSDAELDEKHGIMRP